MLQNTRSVDFIYLRPDGNTSPEACRLVEADERFHGSAWVELQEQVQFQKVQKEIAATSERQSGTEFRAKVNAIVSSAAEQTKTAQTGQSNRARVTGIRANRKLEREHERRLAVLTKPLEEEKLMEDIDPGKSHEPGVESYTPPPSQLKMLASHQEEQWKNS